ncbi:MAG: T9SS type A sorting domain-containing protein [Calditrichaeota bacterium]|nr:T9SS type A sorting domain-containing protein [Calditrichota bacterium]
MLLVLGASQGLAQFAVVSTVPGNGATNVDTAATFVITFNAPLDTSARFAWPRDFYIGLSMTPEPGEPDSVTLSPDLRTVRIHNLHLWPDTRFCLAILGARSSTGSVLQLPVVVTFTTGSTLPTATVSGIITLPGGDPSGTVVALFSDLFSGDVQAMAVVPGLSGAYMAQYVPPGRYWPVALKDVDHSGDFDPNPAADLLAVYDPNGDGVADSLVVDDGATVTGVNMTLSTFTALTARQRYAATAALVRGWSADADLVWLAAPDLSPSGTAPLWLYLFFSRREQRLYGIMASSFFLAPFHWDEEVPDTTALPDNWVDSDVAADSAEAHAGEAFRQANPDAHLSAFLSHLELPATRKLARLFPEEQAPRWAPEQPRGLCQARVGSLQLSTSQSSLRLGRPNFMATAAPVWAFMYLSESTGELWTAFIDAESGRFLAAWPPPVLVTTARFCVPLAEQAALAWAQDAQLVFLGTHLTSLSPSGQAEMWFYAYHSPSRDSLRGFFFYAGMLVLEGEIPPLLSPVPLPASWVDSDVAALVAETNGGSTYRATQSDVWVTAILGTGSYPSDPNLPVWYVQYLSSTAEEMTVFVDARTGNLVTGVEHGKPTLGTAGVFALLPNYPNPFNPVTTIEYHVREKCRVRLEVLDPLGRRIATLLDEEQSPGVHRVQFHAGSLPSGVYLCRIETHQFAAVRKMVIVR